MKPHVRHLLSSALPVAVVVGALSALMAPAQAAAPANGTAAAVTTQYAYQGSAFGTQVKNNTVKSGRSAPVALGCTTTPGISKTNNVASVNAAPVLTTGTVVTTEETFAGPIEARTSATVQNVNLLSGLITATEVKSVSSTTHDDAGFHTSAAGTTFTSLVVAGLPVTVTPAPNTSIDIPDVGYVVLNEQKSRMQARSASLTVNAIHLYVTAGDDAGTQVRVAHAYSGLDGPVIGTLDGFAYGTSVTLLDGTVTSGPSFRQGMPCLGTKGILRTNTGVGVSLPGILVTGTITNTAQGDVTKNSATGETTSSVESANVLDGLVQATVIKADAHASSDGTTFTFSDAGSSFGTLSVADFPDINADVAANTKLVIPDVGKLWLHRVILKPNSIEVRMIELIIKTAQPGLPVGSDIQVAVAHASVH